MPSRRVLRSVLRNFLGTYTSRYSSYDGCWLFGFVVHDLDHVDFDLLAEVDVDDRLVRWAHQLAVRTFADQLAKAGLDRSNVIEARLSVDRVDAVEHTVNARLRRGWNHRFRAHATTDTGRTFVQETVIFVAPHDPRAEFRSRRRRGAPVVSGNLDL